MSFDIKNHIIDHAFYVVNNLKHDVDLIHFNTSADLAYFIVNGYVTQDKIDHVMRTVLDNLLKKVVSVREKNGTYLNKKGLKQQKYRIREILFSHLLSVYHNRHFDASKSVNPHFHFLFHSKLRMGKNFMYLRQALEEEANRYGIKFNFMEDKQETGLSLLKLKYLKRMSWLFHQGDEKKINDFIHSDADGLKRNLDSLMTHYEHTNNLSFFMKTLLIVNQRLDELNLDYIYRNVNLREKILFFLSPCQLEKLENLKQDRTISINTDNVFDREILKYAYGFQTEVMDIIVDKFDIQDIEKDQLIIEETIITNSIEKKNNIGFRDLVIMDIRNALSVAKNYREFRSLLTDMEYKKIVFKTSQIKLEKRENIGLNIRTKKNTNIFIPFHQLRVSWKKMKMIFHHNTNKNKKGKKLVTNLDRYEKTSNKINTELVKFEYKVPKLLELVYKEKINDIKIENFDNYHVERSDMYNITTLMNNDNSIVVTESRIILKKSSDDNKSINDILKIVELKGWDMNHIILAGKNSLVEKTNLQIVQQMKKSENIFSIMDENDWVSPIVKIK